jgi:arylsulfatase A-like enzyme
MQILLMEVHEGWKLVRPEFKQNYRNLGGAPRGYWDGVRQLSFDVGWFVEQLGATRGWEDTLFVITSDHGQGLDDHPDVVRSWGHGLLLYDSHVKVPLILYSARRSVSPFRWGARAGRTLEARQVDEPVRLIDVMPTLLDYVGAPVPSGIHGRSLFPLMVGAGAVELPSYFVTETYYDGSHKLAAHGRGWTYIENRDGHRGVNAFELQAAGAPTNGRRTDRIRRQPLVARRLAAYLRDWERTNPKRPATQPRQPKRERLEQLRALGYVK